MSAHQGPSLPTTLHTPAPTPDPLAPPTPAAPHLKLYTQGDSPSGGGGGGGVVSNGATAAGGGACFPAELVRRPLLPAAEKRLDPMEDEHSLHMLYDYTTVHAWLEHPVKRFKGEEKKLNEESAPSGDLYANEHYVRPPDCALMHDIKIEKQEPEDSKEYKNLFRSDGLCPTLKDLEQIFDNSDDANSGDETLQVSTPPDSNKSCEVRCVRAEELSKMFPTPPSMEPHAQASPGFCDDSHLTHLPHLLPHRHHASPPADTIEDWSYVFKPATVYKYVGSSKYAPLSSLPSQLLPPVSLPPHAVYRPRWQHDREREPEPSHGAAHLADDAGANTNSTSGAGGAGGVKRPLSAAGRDRSVGSVAAGAAGAGAECERAAAPACPLLVNVLLADTVLNVFRDHNFDSCTLCVCNAAGRVNITRLKPFFVVIVP
ncbi:mediator of RNA polymerase II transcription subunit 13-like [Leptidea sinapis]|uniref:mediator of RNA polymerase II transcription subunit 13-like n=1 Tax=Leptidea sinapis TaxID=189913 RepID=UPI0021C2DD3C|nr:mediator of RNA polymerase II transcription subunit 13-like [Leptidea sinapis]